MYTVALKRELEAEHCLPEMEGKENEIHSHSYTAEIKLTGSGLDERGYLMDINSLEEVLEDLISKFEGNVLNELPEFDGHNPTIENFSKVFWEKIRDNLEARNLESLEVKIWESSDAYASYKGRLKD